MSVDLVVSVYRDSIDWLRPFQDAGARLFCYDKWDKKERRETRYLTLNATKAIPLPNVGKIDHTNAHHIVTHWDDLSDWTVFTVDAPFDRMHEVSMADCLTPGEHLRVPRLWKGRDWDPVTGRLNWHQWGSIRDRNGTNWKDRYESGIITPAALSFVEWMRKYIGFDPNGPDWPGYAPGGIMGVPRRAITYLPRAFYERLRDQLSHAVEPEEGHFCERAWTAIFVGKARYLPEEATV